MLTSQREFFVVVPAAPVSRVLPRMPFTFTDRDIFFMTTIYGATLAEIPGGSLIQRWAAENSGVGYDTFVADIPTRISSSPERAESAESAEMMPEYFRLYSAMKKSAIESGRSLLSYLTHTRFFQPDVAISNLCKLSTSDFEREVLKYEIFEGQSILEAMDQVVELLQHIREITGYRRYIEESQSLAWTNFVSGYLGQKKSKESFGTRSVKEAFSWAGFATQGAQPPIGFPAMVGILNLSVLKKSPTIGKLNGQYRAYLEKVVEPRVILWASCHADIATPLMSLTPRMRLAFKLPYGSRLRVFLETAEIMHGFNVDIAKSGKPEWQGMYEFLMVELRDEDTIESYAVWNASIPSVTEIRGSARSTHREMLDAVMSAFATMIVDNPDLQRAFFAFVPVIK
jgi:hypothetical protein